MATLEQVVNYRLAVEYQRREHLSEKISRLSEATGKALAELAQTDLKITTLRERLAKTEKAVA